MFMSFNSDVIKKTFTIDDYLHAKKFSSFLPAIAGVDGKPLWVFYANVGQCVGGFGVNSKDYPIAPFDSAYLAYQNIPFRGFNTALELDGKVFKLFDPKNISKTKLEITRDSITISEETNIYKVIICYSTLSNNEFGGLIRKVSLENKLNKSIKAKIIDGLSVMLPYGLSNYSFQNLSTLMSSYCCVDINNDTPYLMYKGGEDTAEVKKNTKGNGFFAINEYGKTLTALIDPNNVFLDGVTSEIVFDKVNNKQIDEGQIACGMVYDEFEFTDSYSFISFYGSFDSIKQLNNFKKKENFESLEKEVTKTRDLIESLIKVSCSTSNYMFDEFIKQSYFDNALRGGFPLTICNKNLYVFSRKHGDMERDYNDFVIPYSYFSSGQGNFRDVNQNRRSDLYVKPTIFDKNLFDFFTLIQLDGYNPLIVKPTTYYLNKKYLDKFDKKYASFNYENYSLSDLYGFIKTNNLNICDFEKILSLSDDLINASSGEGYWVDHWTYNIDLLENFISIFPDKFALILNDKKYLYFNNPLRVNPKTKRYCLIDNKIRQYNSIEKVETSTNFILDKENKPLKVTLKTKIFNLILIKSISLDSNQLGIEMEAGKPGWNDALNGLPGLFGSSMNETIELLRLTKFYKENISGDVEVLLEQKELFNEAFRLISNGIISRFDYWDKTSDLRDAFRSSIYSGISGDFATIHQSEVDKFLDLLIALLNDSIKRAKKWKIMPTYFINEVNDYQIIDGKIVIRGFFTKPLNQFLEVYTHLGKLSNKYFNSGDYMRIKETDIFDKKFHLYKTCGSIEKETYELGRIRSFSSGWLERECAFLHMSYKYLVSLFDSAQYDTFFNECSNLLTFNRDPLIYGRNPVEASSFIVPSCNKNEKLHGQGFFARLTGANAEVIDLFYKTFIGDKMFEFKNGKLSLNLNPKIPVSLFKEKKVSFTVFSNKTIIYQNPKLLPFDNYSRLSYLIRGKEYNIIPENLVKEFRDGNLNLIEVIIS